MHRIGPATPTRAIGHLGDLKLFAQYSYRWKVYSTVSNLFNTTKVEAALFNFLQIPLVTYTPPRFVEFGIRAKF